MNGMAARPMHVGNHFLATGGSFDRLQAWPANQVSRLITMPGTMTDANICQRNTSPATFIAGTNLLPPTSSGFCWRENANKILREKVHENENAIKFHKMLSYPVHLHRFVHTIGNYVSDGHPIAGMNEPFRNDWSKTFAHFVGIACKSRKIVINEKLARECC